MIFPYFFMYHTLETVKNHLLIDKDFHDDDQILLVYLQAAEAAAEAHLNKKLINCLEDGRLPYNISVAILMMIGNFYNNREATSYSTVQEVPLGARYLLDAVKYWNVP